MTDGGGAQPMDLAAILQQLAAGMPAPAPPPPPPQPTVAQPAALDAILGAQAILSTPMYQNLARMLMMNQMNQMLQQQQPVQQNHANLLAHHMSLKRTLPAPIPTMEHLRKRSAPVPQPPPPPRSPTPPLKKWLQNLTPEQKAKNEMFNREIMKRLDVILLEELGDDEEMEEDQEEKMGSAGSAFRRILSRTDDDTPSIGSLSSGPNSPPIEVEPLSQESVEMLVELGKKHREERGDVEMIGDEEGFEKWYPVSWSGNIVMKSSEVPLSLHLVSGSREYLQSVLGDATHPQRTEIRINQRLRLETGIPHLYKLLTGDDFCCCIGVPAGLDRDQLKKSTEMLETAFVDYLNAKGIAGIGLLPPVSTEKQDQPSRVHIFAPNEIVTRYMNQLAPDLFEHITRRKLRYVLFVFGTNESTTISSNSENVNVTSQA